MDIVVALLEEMKKSIPCKDLPWTKCPSSNKRAYNLSSAYIDILHHTTQTPKSVNQPINQRSTKKGKEKIEGRNRTKVTFGHSAVISLPAHNEFAETFVPIVARQNANDAKNAAARLSHLSISLSGSQRTSPYKVEPALVTAMPTNPQRVNASGMMMSWMYWLHI